MYYGKMTKELHELCSKYREKFNNFDPCGYMELEYGDRTYDSFVADIQTCLRTGKELPELYPVEEDVDDLNQEPTDLQIKFKKMFESKYPNLESILNKK